MIKIKIKYYFNIIKTHILYISKIKKHIVSQFNIIIVMQTIKCLFIIILVYKCIQMIL